MEKTVPETYLNIELIKAHRPELLKLASRCARLIYELNSAAPSAVVNLEVELIESAIKELRGN